MACFYMCLGRIRGADRRVLWTSIPILNMDQSIFCFSIERMTDYYKLWAILSECLYCLLKEWKSWLTEETLTNQCHQFALLFSACLKSSRDFRNYTCSCKRTREEKYTYIKTFHSSTLFAKKCKYLSHANITFLWSHRRESPFMKETHAFLLT